MTTDSSKLVAEQEARFRAFQIDEADIAALRPYGDMARARLPALLDEMQGALKPWPETARAFENPEVRTLRLGKC